MNDITTGQEALITRERIAAAERVIRPYVRHTPIIEIDAGEFGLAPRRLIFKLEQLQHSGSFKARGAFANLLMREIPPAGIAAASGGNHGVAVSYAAMKRGVPAKIFLPSISSPAKIARIHDYGVDLVVGGEDYAEALAASEAYIAQSGALKVHAFDQVETLLGQGSVGLELVPRHSDFDWLISSHSRMGRRSGATRSSMLLGTPGWRRIKPFRSSVTTI